MEFNTLLLFALTVLPLICTPGPDILFISSQGLSGGMKSAWIANSGVISGYLTHALLSALGLAALVSTSPILFHLLKWVGVTYISYLALKMLISACKKGTLVLDTTKTSSLFRKGFLTSFLNPKGLLVYLAILPNFIDNHNDVATQSLLLSGIFITTCLIIYGLLGSFFAYIGVKGGLSDKRRRYNDGIAGGLLAFAAVNLAFN
ncbi:MULTISPECIES: LysE family translocator [Proteus]|jgi:threonine/homoserine/homoserine lactone efflux protein|uniref:LysE-type transporter n=1 Tax=Proteus vulgaris TaxID=585 RepID=A0A379FDI2_PROVU|nr:MULTISPECIES: LysE family translocator [Proteus]NBN60686.1 LysE family transporter [Proteus sp. G2639]RNT28962.1 LysE family translocator [Proteus mirabilis]AYY80802.1 LysE family translocator [Proteus vulgaris]KGA59837.1 lysE type translocator family protein [Proteus vulgaris]MBG5969514.1 LysE family translocator [Proteus vulgaris]